MSNPAKRLRWTQIGQRLFLHASPYERLRHCYRFDARGQVAVKGKGLMPVYLLRETLAAPVDLAPLSA